MITRIFIQIITAVNHDVKMCTSCYIDKVALLGVFLLIGLVKCVQLKDTF